MAFWQSTEKPRVLHRTLASPTNRRDAGGADGPEQIEELRKPHSGLDAAAAGSTVAAIRDFLAT